MKYVPHTLYGLTRRTAYELWRGPVSVQRQDETDLSGGLCVLHLALRQGTSGQPLIESRSVYASLAHEPPDDALLRAVYWNSHTAPRRGQVEDAQIKIPAKFVLLPISYVHQWIGMLERLPTVIRAFPDKDDSLPICSLRVDTRMVASVFEQVWQVMPDQQSELTHVWQTIWQEMALALQNSPTVTDIEEHFPCVQLPQDAYDFQQYQPSLDIS